MIFSFTGVVQRRKGIYSLQVSREEEIVTAMEAEGRAAGKSVEELNDHLRVNAAEHPWIFLQHSFTPTVCLEQEQSADSVILSAVALTDIDVGGGITFDYTLHSWDMDAPFHDESTGRWVQGFGSLTEAEMDAALPRAAAHIKSMHGQWLFGQHSRC